MARQPDNSTTIIYVRHGVTPTTGKILPGRAKGLFLSDQGVAQAEAVADRLAVGPKIGALYCSPLERTRQTAKPIAAALGLRANAHRGFLECDFGDWTGMDLKKLNKLQEWKGVVEAPESFRFPNGESFLAMQTRVRDGIAELTIDHPGETVVVVSHADPIKMALCLALNATLRSMHHIDVAPCSMTTVRYGPNGNASVVRVNEVTQSGDLK